MPPGLSATRFGRPALASLRSLEEAAPSSSTTTGSQTLLCNDYPLMTRVRASRASTVLYFYPLGTGVTKSQVGLKAGMAGWSHPTNYFSCCMGTGVEAHAKLQSEVFFFGARLPRVSVHRDCGLCRYHTSLALTRPPANALSRCYAHVYNGRVSRTPQRRAPYGLQPSCRHDLHGKPRVCTSPST